MPNYRYKAIRDDGSFVSGEAFAATSEALESSLAVSGLFVTKIRRVTGFSRAGRVADEDMLLFLKQFTSLLKAGQSVPEALRLSKDTESPSISRLLERILPSVVSGEPLSEAVSSGARLEPMFATLLRIGETSGDISQVLENYMGLLERRIALSRKLKQAMLYPLFVLFMLSVIIFVLFSFSLPRFVQMYADFDAQLPPATRALMSVSEWILRNGVALAFVAVISGGVAAYLSKRPSVREWWHSMVLRMPLVGVVQRYHALAIFSRGVSTLLNSGVGLVDALAQTAALLPNIHMAHAVRELGEQIAQGQTLAQALDRSRLLPASVKSLLLVGDTASKAATRLAEIAAYYEDILDYRLTAMLSLLEPVLVLITGLIVGTVVIIMYLPVFSLAGAVG